MDKWQAYEIGKKLIRQREAAGELLDYQAEIQALIKRLGL